MTAGSDGPITCCVRYVVDPGQIQAFELYAVSWMRLIERHGGTNHGYFLPRPTPLLAGFSFPGVGREGPDDVAVALFSFPNVAAYQAYRREVALDPDCEAAEALYRDTRCFLSYERTFLKPLPVKTED
jgi:hypothetical protein